MHNRDKQSLHFSGNKQFKRLVEILRPGTTVPNRHKISDELIDKIYDEEKLKVAVVVNGLSATIVIDGWSTLDNQPVLGISFYSGGKSFLVNTIDTSEKPHTTEYLVDVLDSEVKRCEIEWKVKVQSAVTDNAANMKAMRTAYKEKTEGESMVHVYGCQAHVANLVAKDYLSTKEMKAVLSKVTSVLKWFRTTHIGSSALREAGIPRPPTACETRWNTATEVLDYFVKHWNSLGEIINTKLSSTDPVYRFMEEIQLKRSAADALLFLKPLATALDKFQSKDCGLSLTYETWQSVIECAPDTFVEKLSNRRNMAASDVQLAAYLLDLIENFSQAKFLKLNSIYRVSENKMPEVSKYLAKQPPYSSYLFEGSNKDVDPVSWWKSGLRLGFSTQLVGIAVSLVSAVSSSAGLERHFSSLGLTYGCLRTRLGIEKAGKLAFLNQQLNN